MATEAEQKPTGPMKTHTVGGGGGLQLHVREWGKADGPPILFIHRADPPRPRLNAPPLRA
jgi:pimeloyl-ACP methyl ester carboxylesterase